MSSATASTHRSKPSKKAGLQTVPRAWRAQNKDVIRGQAGKKAPGAAKLAISFEGNLAAQVRRAAKKQAAGNVSAWLAEAARERLQLQARRDLLEEFEARHGPITDAELAEVEKRWPEG
jgi:hypothetical protein